MSRTKKRCIWESAMQRRKLLEALRMLFANLSECIYRCHLAEAQLARAQGKPTEPVAKKNGSRVSRMIECQLAKLLKGHWITATEMQRRKEYFRTLLQSYRLHLRRRREAEEELRRLHRAEEYARNHPPRKPVTAGHALDCLCRFCIPY